MGIFETQTIQRWPAAPCCHHCPPWGYCGLPMDHEGAHGYNYEAGRPAYILTEARYQAVHPDGF